MNIPVNIADATSRRPSARGVARLLIVDDSVVARSAIKNMLAGREGVEVVAKHASIDSAIAFLRETQVDIILLDHEMPGQTGVEGLPAILAVARGARVAILSGRCARNSEAAVRALALGAGDIIDKPDIRHINGTFADMLVARLQRLATPALMSRSGGLDATLRPVPSSFKLACLGIGASTGGIHALAQMLEGRKLNLGVPVLVTQHLPATFVPYFADQLARMTNLPVGVARDGEPLRPNHIYVAPGMANLLAARTARGGVVARLMDERASRLDPLPAVNPMFSAMAETYGGGAAAIVLTGMGRDGAQGAHAICAAGGMVLAQDRESSVIWGMPGEVARVGLASALLPPEHMLDYLIPFCGNGR